MTEKFKKLINPKTDNYYKLKQYVLGGGINWFYAMYSTPPNEKSDNVIRQYRNGKLLEYVDDEYQNIPYFSHIVVERPQEVNYASQNECTFSGVENNLIPMVKSKSYELYVEPFLKDLILSLIHI